MPSRSRRTLLDALRDKVVEFVDSIDVSKVLEERVPTKKKQLVVDTTASDVAPDEGREPPP